ncbi:hypothetical protein K2173_023294 [Erythroxylum novogranatense]|uniref:non-specific serine/threonine protein kinase n=1 Tax=Erythroxylum novogranatense TaxID=1862640 RepID=A0AAV8T9T7_9ROSI|nr:hypothetical protein K2173_023294 [Erythroxylum novogranatense]
MVIVLPVKPYNPLLAISLLSSTGMKKQTPFISKLLLVVWFSSNLLSANSQGGSSSEDAAVMQALKISLNSPDSLGWSDPDPCEWKHVGCSDDKRVTRIQIGHQNLQGTLPSDLQNLTQLERLELQWNNISGPLPSLNGLSSLLVLMLTQNQFTSIPSDFFDGLSSLQSVELDYNPFSRWVIPESIKNAPGLQNFSANAANISGSIPEIFGPDVFPSLTVLHLAFNALEGSLPASFSGSSIQSLWLNAQTSASKLTGGIDVIRNMTMLNELWLHSNQFSGPLPDLSALKNLQRLNLRDNSLTGPVPLSLENLQSLEVVNLTNNLLQGSVPKFKDSVSVDLIADSNSFCLPNPGDCDPRVDTLLSILKTVYYPRKFAENWKGNDPCANWIGITCRNGNITVVNFEKMGLSGTISPDFVSLKSLERLLLADNNLTGHIPEELVTLPGLNELDVSNNLLYGKLPPFKSNVLVVTNGNPNIGKDIDNTTSGSPTPSPGFMIINGKKSSASVITIVFSIIGGVLIILLIGLLVFCVYNIKQKKLSKVQSPNAVVIQPRRSGSDNESVKITVAGSSVSVSGISEAQATPTSEHGSIQMVEAGNMVISIQLLKNVTNNFSDENILGQGGFGVVYKGELQDGTKIAVKRMLFGLPSGKGLGEFKSEIAVLTKVRHRHLVALLGYCLDGNEKLLVYEYMPQGTLSRHLFNWAQEGLKPLGWTERLIIALDVARGVEYLHGLARETFIHRDLKPSNILLGDDMRAKVADFGLVRPAPEGKGSIETRVAGTFGYLAPEYAVTGRVTTKVDVFSFGVILMELITGRKALDETQSEESMHLVTWFRRMYLNKDAFHKAIDPIIDLNPETITSINKVAELAGHCCAREPYQRPDMGHAVNVLSCLIEQWKPTDDHPCPEDNWWNVEMSLPKALEKWQAYDDRSDLGFSTSLPPSYNNTQTSIPPRPPGLADSLRSEDGR